MFSVAAVVTFVGSTFLNGLALAATPDTELGKAYEWAHSKGITTMDTYEAANMDKPITRAQMAKMLSVYAMSELGMKPDTTKTECNEFNDIANITGDLHEYIITSCQLGLMGQQIFSGIKEFRPNANISRAEFGTALSRTLWGGKYEGGTPYYANHLQALQSAGIMKIIANAETTQEIRGYVMLMLMRSAEGSETKADCEDPMIKAACLIDDDSCPAECKASDEKDEDNKVVKSGDLLIKATPSTNRRAVINWVSDLDTITLKASETITLNSVTLERYGYSDGGDVIGVWLENAEGKEITNHKTLSKDKVTLNLKKDYKELGSTDEFTIVVELKNAKAGGTIGFKVTDADASAKNLDLSDYDPYTYDLVDYSGATLTITQKGKADTYNYTKGESYEVQRFKVKSEAAAISVYGFTLKNEGSVKIRDGVEKVTVTVNDEKVDNLKWSINSKDELQINFDEVELAIRETSIFAVNFVFVDGFEDLNKTVRLTLAKSDFNATEKKTGSRVDVDAALPGNIYTIRGWKIELTNTKLGTVEAAADTDDVVFGKGEISIGGEAIILNPFEIEFEAVNTQTNAKYPAIKDVRISVDGDEISANCETVIDGAKKETTTCAFEKTTDVDKDSKIEFLLNISQYAEAEETIKVVGKTTFGKGMLELIDAASGIKYIGKYDDANEYALSSDFIGSIDLNNIKVQTPKAALENKKSKTVEFTQWKSSTETIFEGTYTAKKKDVYLNSFKAVSTANADETAKRGNYDELALNVYVDGKKVATTDVVIKTVDGNDVLYATEDFAKVLVEAGKSVDVKVEAKAYANNPADAAELQIYFSWEDKDGNDAGTADDVAAQFKAVEKGSVSVSDSTYETSKDFRNNSVSLKKSNATIAKFDLKPSKSSSTVDLDTFTFTVKDLEANQFITDASKIRVKVWTDSSKNLSYDATDGVFVVNEIDETLENNGITVEISTKWNPTASKYLVTLVNVNEGTDVNKQYNQYILPVEVTFTQKDMWWSTKIIAEMDKWDNDVEIKSIELQSNGAFTPKAEITSISEGSNWEVEISGDKDSVKMIDTIIITTDETYCTDAQYTTEQTCTNAWEDWTSKVYTIEKGTYNDYFRVGDTYLKVFKA